MAYDAISFFLQRLRRLAKRTAAPPFLLLRGNTRRVAMNEGMTSTDKHLHLNDQECYVTLLSCIILPGTGRS